MRPVNLIMSAFGPYATRTEINMDQLGTQGLYLITGDTGAGKSTIFDAICFALYGEASGPNRETGMLRSKYAADDVPTEVQLKFLHGGKEYLIKRNPEYMRAAKRNSSKSSSGLTKQPADAELHMPDGEVITKVGNVTAAVERILGVNKEQFSQISMLAQGDFLKLLLADTKSRMEIFRELFKTQKYMSLQKTLDNEQKKVYVLVEDGKKSVAQFIAGIQADSDDVLSIDAEKAKAGELTTEAVVELLDKLNEKDKIIRNSLDMELDRISHDLESVNAALGAAEALFKTTESLTAAENRLKAEEPKIGDLENMFISASDQLKDKSDLEKKSAKLEAELTNYDQADRLESEIISLQKNIDLQKKTIDKSDKEQADRKIELEKLRQERESVKDTSAEIEKLKTALQKIMDEADNIKELSDYLAEYSQDQERLKAAREDYIQKDAVFNDLKKIYDAKEQAFRDGQAGILAEKLKDGEACPVCGSTHHPVLAHRPDHVPTEKELDSASKELERARVEREKSAANAGSLSKVLETRKSQLIKQSTKLINTDDPDIIPEKLTELKNDCKTRHSNTTKALKTAQTRENRKIELEKLIPSLEQEIEEENIKIEKLRESMAADDSLLKEKTSNIETLRSSLPFADRKSAISEKNRLDELAKEIQKRYDNADKTLKEQKITVEKLKAEINSYRSTIASSKPCDIEVERARQQELNIAQKDCIDKSKAVASRLRTNEEIRQNIITRSKDIMGLEKKLQWMRALSDTANGKLAGKDKIMLETYIQMTYFDRIINRANIRLMTMSSGQYELTRMKEASNFKSQSGLDLGVIDHYNGSERSVKTLSGGESFMASLSLALGLSDEVQSSAGGISIDTIFVDEGFGSLDPESLDQAYKALAGLTEGNRLVGIISHVADLKERIDKQILVTKNKSGGSVIDLKL